MILKQIVLNIYLQPKIVLKKINNFTKSDTSIYNDLKSNLKEYTKLIPKNKFKILTDKYFKNNFGSE